MNKQLILKKYSKDSIEFKIIVSIIFMTLFFILATSLLAWGFTINKTSFVSGDVKLQIGKDFESWRTARGIGLALCGWIFGMAIIIFRYLLALKKYNGLKYFLLHLPVLLPIIQLFYLIEYYYSDYMKNIFFKLKKYFKFDNFDNQNNNYWTNKHKLSIVVGIICSFTIVALFLPKDNFAADKLWFDSLHFYTLQTNILILIYTIIFIFFPKLKLFKSDMSLNILSTYIFIVGVVATVSLIPISLVSGTIYSPWEWVKTIFLHIINPSIFCIWSIICMKKWQSNIFYKFNDVFAIGYILPICYFIYLFLSPFVSGTSVYGVVTNLNPLLKVGEDIGSWFIIFVFIFLIFFFLFSFKLFWKINNKKINTKTFNNILFLYIV